jgi:hypothetical protein
MWMGENDYMCVFRGGMFMEEQYMTKLIGKTSISSQQHLKIILVILVNTGTFKRNDFKLLWHKIDQTIIVKTNTVALFQFSWYNHNYFCFFP